MDPDLGGHFNDAGGLTRIDRDDGLAKLPAHDEELPLAGIVDGAAGILVIGFGVSGPDVTAEASPVDSNLDARDAGILRACRHFAQLVREKKRYRFSQR